MKFNILQPVLLTVGTLAIIATFFRIAPLNQSPRRRTKGKWAR